MDDTDPRNRDNWIPRETFAAYCDAHEGLLRYYDTAYAKRKPVSISFDLLALVAFPLWSAYWRQWPLWWAFTIVVAGLAFVEILFGFDFPNSAFLGSRAARQRSSGSWGAFSYS